MFPSESGNDVKSKYKELRCRYWFISKSKMVFKGKMGQPFMPTMHLIYYKHANAILHYVSHDGSDLSQSLIFMN